MNAMAISLRGRDFGTVVDFFGGYRDLRGGVIRVLHNLSFVEDPTRIFRALRYENRYGFRMDEHTRSLAKSCVEKIFIIINAHVTLQKTDTANSITRIPLRNEEKKAIGVMRKSRKILRGISGMC